MTTRLRIATFNLENLDDSPDADPPLDTRITVLRPQLERLDADILCLQEVNGQRPPGGGPRELRALDRLLDGTPYADFHRIASSNPAGAHRGVADKHNLVILSRYAFSDWREIRHDLVPAPTYRQVTAKPPADASAPVSWERPVLAATIALPSGARLNVLNLHLRAPLAAHIPGQKEDAFAWRTVSGWAEGFFMAAVKRIGQAFEARLAIEQMLDADPQALICVCGDCNAEEREMPLRVLRADVADTGNARLSTRALVSLEQEIAPDRRYSVLHAGYKAMLDHLLASRALLGHLRGIEVHNEALGDELVGAASAHKSPESYHAPLVAEFGF